MMPAKSHSARAKGFGRTARAKGSPPTQESDLDFVFRTCDEGTSPYKCCPFWLEAMSAAY